MEFGLGYNHQMKKKTLTLLLCYVFFLNISPAVAVVNGSEIANADATKPWVAQIYYTESIADNKTSKFICSGSLISKDMILTAAHCVLNTGFYFVTLGARTLNSTAPRLEVEATWRHPRYSERKIVNDLGILKLTQPVLNVKPVPLATDEMNKKINAIKSYTVYGWGIDQNKNPAVYLKTAKLTNQDKVAKSKLVKYGYLSANMLAAGNYLKNEKIYAGVCNGDSGGPLVSNFNGVETLIGVTSWGIVDSQGYCDLGFPSVFSRVSYFLGDIEAGVLIAQASAIDNNRAAPLYLVKPEISGSARVGSTITCDTGKWGKSTTSVDFKWTSPSGATTLKSQSIQVTANDAGKTFTCEVVGSSKTASLPVTSSISIPNKPSSNSNAFIVGIDSNSTIKSGTVATCSGVKWNSPVESESVKWYLSSSGPSLTEATSTQIGSSSSLILTTLTLQTLYGKSLVCAITGTSAGGSTTYTDYRSINKPSAPSSISVTVSGISGGVTPTAGTIATCSASTPSSYDSMSYEWGYVTSSGSYTSPLANSLGKSSTLTLTQDVINSATAKYLVCVATATNIGGSGSGYATTYISPPPLSVSGAPAIGVATVVNATTAIIAFTAPSFNGNSAITSYVATSNPGAKIGLIFQSSSGKITVTGLTAGTSYTFTVKAINSVGTSAESSPSNSITPTTTTTPTPTTTTTPTVVENQRLSVILIKSVTNSGNTFTAVVRNGIGPFRYSWIFSEGGYDNGWDYNSATLDLPIDAQCTNKYGKATVWIPFALQKILNKSDDPECRRSLTFPYNNSVEFWVQVTDLGYQGNNQDLLQAYSRARGPSNSFIPNPEMKLGP